MRQGSLCTSVNQPGLELTDPLASTSRVLGLKVCANMSGSLYDY